MDGSNIRKRDLAVKEKKKEKKKEEKDLLFSQTEEMWLPQQFESEKYINSEWPSSQGFL